MSTTWSSSRSACSGIARSARPASWCPEGPLMSISVMLLASLRLVPDVPCIMFKNPCSWFWSSSNVRRKSPNTQHAFMILAKKYV
ncbi:hypothetical protein E2562_003133 [Oryza meyeriana var. granulata]|uniref:Uncharacterized protein n=1 Tax=Oryza meyeriana var. granulata TaxID=110450 RepID=A0A6G1EBM3_9ORYZ|nr:hypothetical protein E2562_003133 [Oryza meyeriana var. granulata]